ncbi:hypothetical protein KIN20_031459 [Parelaphostrongylus tenuis]|uniref:Uncharacterized protein n=1 Tax=Parelaphostrongylus tenuis TaxID=148309 RepID=A0AAD5WGT9_PARTN|nr:hypothetical protein KIN20_031459 [Parelaphostrongylus tenuis]
MADEDFVIYTLVKLRDSSHGAAYKQDFPTILQLILLSTPEEYRFLRKAAAYTVN